MSKKIWAIIFVKGILLLIIGIWLSSKELPYDEVGAVTYAGNKIMDSINQTANLPDVSDITKNAKRGFGIIGIGSMIAGILEIIISGIFLFKF